MEVRRSGILATVAVLVVVAVCLRLGFWQLDRRDQRIERNAAVTERMEAAPLALTTAPADTAGLLHRVANVTGVFDHDRTIVLGGRSYGGAPGVYVLTPLRLGDAAVLVNRGWVPARDAATIDLAALPRPYEGRVTGVLVPFPDVRLPPPEEAFRARWFRLDGEAIRAQYPYRVAPLYLQATGHPEPGPGVAGVGPVPLDPPIVDPGPHLGYAVQWFSFAAIFLFGWATLAFQRFNRPAPEDG